MFMVAGEECPVLIQADAVWSQNSAAWQVLFHEGLTRQLDAVDWACPAAF